MSGALHTWYSLADLEALGARSAALDGEIELDRLARLRGLLQAHDGRVRATLRFRRRNAGWLTLELECRATLKLVCQRCLEPMKHDVAERVEMAVLESPAMAEHLPEGFEPVILDEEGRLAPAQLIEDELIVSIPLAPKHLRIDDCGILARDLGSPTEKRKPARSHSLQ